MTQITQSSNSSSSTSKEITKYLGMVQECVMSLDRAELAQMADAIHATYEREGTIYVFGNGGSGANASHFAGDLMKGVSHGLKKRFKAVCLNDNTPGIFAIANDIHFHDVFAEQLKNFLTPNDLVIAISGSGNSPNIIKAVDYANKVGAKTIGLCGFDGGKLKQMVTYPVHVNFKDMEVSEDMHLVALHCVKKALMARLGTSGC